MVRKQEKSDLTGLIKWKFQKVTFFLVTLYYSRNQAKPAIRVISEEELNAELRSLGMMTTHELEAKYGDG